MNRRDFLKLMGVAAAAAYGVDVVQFVKPAPVFEPKMYVRFWTQYALPNHVSDKVLHEFECDSITHAVLQYRRDGVVTAVTEWHNVELWLLERWTNEQKRLSESGDHYSSRHDIAGSWEEGGA